MLEVKISDTQITGLREVVRELKQVEPESYKALRRDLRRAANPYIKNIKAYIKGAEQRLQAPGMSSGKGMGVFHNGRTGWSFPTVSLNFSPSKYKGSVLSITATGRNKQYGYDILEKAGVNALSGKGADMVEAVNRRLGTQKPGRMAFRRIVQELPKIRSDMQLILEAYMDVVSRRIS